MVRPKVSRRDPQETEEIGPEKAAGRASRKTWIKSAVMKTASVHGAIIQLKKPRQANRFPGPTFDAAKGNIKTSGGEPAEPVEYDAESGICGQGGGLSSRVRGSSERTVMRPVSGVNKNGETSGRYIV